MNRELLKPITTILIDIDNTLLDFHLCAEQTIIEGFAEFGLPYDATVIPVFHEVNNYFWGQLEKGELEKKDIFINRWKGVFQRLGIEADAQAFEQRFIDGIARSHEPVQDALEVLAYLAGKYRVCAASNSQYQQQVKRLTSAKMIDYIDEIFVSDTLGAAKPSVEFFQACLREIGDVKKEEILMIGDSLAADVQGGKNAGIATCWYNHHKEENHTGIKADFTIQHLRELYDLI